jgi:hypothetical protein
MSRRGYAGLLSLLTCLGCGVRGTGDYKPAFDCYSRNPVVAVPTLVGNAAGAMLGGVIGLPIMGIERASGRGEDTVGEVVLVTPVLIGGAITGTPFLPIALLLPEHPWVMGPPEISEDSRALLDKFAQRIEASADRADTAATSATAAAYRADVAARRAEQIVREAEENVHEP